MFVPSSMSVIVFPSADRAGAVIIGEFPVHPDAYREVARINHFHRNLYLWLLRRLCQRVKLTIPREAHPFCSTFMNGLSVSVHPLSNTSEVVSVRLELPVSSFIGGPGLYVDLAVFSLQVPNYGLSAANTCNEQSASMASVMRMNAPLAVVASIPFRPEAHNR